MLGNHDLTFLAHLDDSENKLAVGFIFNELFLLKRVVNQVVNRRAEKVCKLSAFYNFGQSF